MDEVLALELADAIRSMGPTVVQVTASPAPPPDVHVAAPVIKVETAAPVIHVNLDADALGRAIASALGARRKVIDRDADGRITGMHEEYVRGD